MQVPHRCNKNSGGAFHDVGQSVADSDHAPQKRNHFLDPNSINLFSLKQFLFEQFLAFDPKQ